MNPYIGIVAGEVSGDLLGAGLIKAIRARFPHARIEGIGGTHMISAGMTSLFPLEWLSVMGLAEVIQHLPRLWKCRQSLKKYFLKYPPDVFVGIDAPDFNLGLEIALKKVGIPTVHYVSPTVWAWREYRLKKIQQACDLMLTLFPFEAVYYQQRNIPVKFVGHPFAWQIPLTSDKQQARHFLKISKENQYVALLPGSRSSEVSKLGNLFLKTAHLLQEKRPLKFLVPLANQKVTDIFKAQWEYFKNVDVQIFDGQARHIIAASDVVLLASGTATLETALIKRPMVVAYQVSNLTYWLAKKLVKTTHFSLPNLLVQQALVPEFIQDQATPEHLATAVEDLLNHPEKQLILENAFNILHFSLRQNSDELAADAVLSSIRER
jgi:lipid-A-disaccharide synthase